MPERVESFTSKKYPTPRSKTELLSECTGQSRKRREAWWATRVLHRLGGMKQYIPGFTWSIETQESIPRIWLHSKKVQGKAATTLPTCVVIAGISSISCMLLGFAKHAKGHSVFDMKTHTVQTSRTIALDERQVDSMYKETCQILQWLIKQRSHANVMRMMTYMIDCISMELQMWKWRKGMEMMTRGWINRYVTLKPRTPA